MPSRVWRGPWLKSGPAQDWPWEEKLLNAVFIVKSVLYYLLSLILSELVYRLSHAMSYAAIIRTLSLLTSINRRCYKVSLVSEAPMPRTCRPHLICIWSCCLLLVFCYVLFDLLDIDGSDFRNIAGGSSVAEATLVSEAEEKYSAVGSSTLWVPVTLSHALAAGPWLTLPSPAAPSRGPRYLKGRPRISVSRRVASSDQPESDPDSQLA